MPCQYLYGQTGQVDAGADHPLVVVRVDADAVRLQIKCILTVLYILQLVLVEVGPPPDSGVDYMWESLPCRHLQMVSSDNTVSKLKSNNSLTCSLPSSVLGMVTHLVG